MKPVVLLSIIPFCIVMAPACAGPIYEVVTSEPYGAQISWGKGPSQLEDTGLRTPHSRKLSASTWESWCYRLNKEGYHDTGVICRPEESYRHVSFRLEPLRTKITSEPAGAKIYWGPSPGEMVETIHRTPLEEDSTVIGASWKAWYFQVRKEGYHNSEVVFLPRSNKDRHVHFPLKAAN